MSYAVKALKPTRAARSRDLGAVADPLPGPPDGARSPVTPPHPQRLASSHPLPTELTMAGEAAGQVRAFLAARGLGHWDIYYHNAADLNDADRHLAMLGEADAAWHPHPPSRNGGEQPAGVLLDDASGADESPACQRAGFLWLRRHQVVLARWAFLSPGHPAWYAVHLWAAPSAQHLAALRRDLDDARRRKARGKWRVYGPQGWRDADEPREAAGWDGLVLDPEVKQRLEAEIVGFFREPVARLYRELDLPYRRGLLLYGPPGNGKTSLIRVIGGLNPDVPGFLLRPGEDFDDSELSGVIETWCRQAPAILVIEDLDWLFHSSRLNVSTFLNMLDGVDRRDGGLLLVATSNHPESLDPAINNRPGRFDVAVEIASPTRDLRLEFFRRSRVGVSNPRVLETLAGMTDGLSFSHLREIESLSGLHALEAGRGARTEGDLFRAAETVVRGYEQARRGFPEPAEPFGLGRLRGRE